MLLQIVQSIPKEALDLELIEIGAGLGDLTNKLLGLGNITAYEVDEELLPYLKERFKKALESKQLELKIGDVMEIWKGNSLRDKPYFLISNLPYYIATLLVIKAIKDPLCKGCVVMTQKEVALKFCAAVKESGFCALSILAQSVGTTSLLFDVPKEAFYPMPKVTSSVFVHQKQQKEALGITKGFEDMLKIAFCAPRKKLFNNLATHYSRTKLESIFKQQQITQNTRPHEVSTQKYHQIYKHLKGTTNE